MSDSEFLRIDVTVLERRVHSFTYRYSDSDTGTDVYRDDPLDLEELSLLETLDASIPGLGDVPEGNYIVDLEYLIDDSGAVYQHLCRWSPEIEVNRHGGSEEGIEATFPLIWALISFLFTRRTRERVFQACYYDLLAQHAHAMRYKGVWARRWLTFCFGLRTAKIAAECLLYDWRMWIAIILAVTLPAGTFKAIAVFLGW